MAEHEWSHERPREHPVDILHDLCERTVGPDKVDHKSFEEAKRSFDAMAKHFSKPIQIPDEWITWEGKEEGRPKPPILWYGEFT